MRLQGWFSAKRWASLSVSMVLALGVGLLVPAVIGVVGINHIHQEKSRQELTAYMNDKVVLLAHSLKQPVWNYDTNAVKQIAEAALLDAQVVRVTVTDAKGDVFLALEQPERRRGNSRLARHQLIFGVEPAGAVELEVDDGQMRSNFLRDRQAYTFILLGQVVLSLALIVAALHLRVLRPLARLTRFSNRLAGGDFEHGLAWNRSDEIGLLALQLDRMRRDLRTSFSEQEAILDNVQVGVVFVRAGRIELVNRHAEAIFAYPEDAMRGLPASALYLSPQQFAAINRRAESAMTGPDRRYEKELMLRRLDGSSFWASIRGCDLDVTARQAGSIWVIEDISERKAAESEINHLAFYDPLTDLPNRRLLLDRLKQAMAASGRSGHQGALLFIDLDNFKTLNDTYGHDTGDLLLQQVAQRILACVRQQDTVARLGGDEFVVLLEDLSTDPAGAAAQAKVVGEKIMVSLNESYRLDKSVRYSTPSIGVALFSGQSQSLDELLKRADMAMYEAKTAGRNTMRFFDKKMQEMLMARSALEDDLREAVLNEQFLLHYQPQVDEAGRTQGVEVLVRWQHPRRGVVSPGEFIPLAEDSGLILPLGRWVLGAACRQLAAWAQRPERAHLMVSVNVSARQFRQPRFVEEVVQALEQSGANPKRLKLELTESMLVDDVEDVIAKMSQLKARGVGFSLDDFGTGYSSLSYLKRLPLDQLKIDQSFVRNILSDPNDAAIAKMVVALALSLGLAVIAEGVEDDAQRAYLAELGCFAYQGYFFSRPLSEAAFEAFCAGA